jgi:beta-glucosidase
MKNWIFVLFILLSVNFMGAQESYLFRNPSINVEARLDNLISLMTLEEKIDMLAGYNDFYIHPVKRLDIPAFTMADGPLGVSSWGIHGRATAFPATISACASWNRKLMNDLGKAYGQEWRSRGIHFILAPGVNIYRASKNGRNFEYFGEDPYLASEMVVPFIKSIQNEGIIATVKHYAGNEQEFDRYYVSSEIDERTLREIYLPPFEAAVKKAGVWAVMTGYNPVNGVWNTQNMFLINDILKGEWGFKGMVMSDWGCTYSTVEAAKAGLDLEMGSNIFFNRKNLIPAVQSGKISIELINDKVKRILRPCFALGFFDREQKRNDIPTYNSYANEMAKNVAREGCVLLKNENMLLPIDKSKVKSIAIVGPNAQAIYCSDRFHKSGAFAFGGGGSSKVNPWVTESILQGISNVADKYVKIYYAEGVSNNFVDKLFESSQFRNTKGTEGLVGEYFANPDFEGKPVLTRNDNQINFSFGDNHNIKGLGDKNYSVRWKGNILPDKSGNGNIFVKAQGAYRLFVDNILVLDKSNSQSNVNDFTSIKFEKNKNVDIKLEFVQKCSPSEIALGYSYTPDWENSEAVKIAKMADMVIFCGGFDSRLELEGQDRDFNLPFGQDQLISALVKANKNTVVTMLAGGGVNMSAWAKDVPAILHAWYPGMEGGRVIGEILFGLVNPSGKLPISIEKRWEDSPAYGNYDETRASGKVFYHEGLFVGYRHFDKNNLEPQFAFGHGLSYTTFEYKNLSISTDKVVSGQKLKIFVDITNTGTIDGAETVQLYVHDVKSSVVRPEKELKGFEKVWLKAGETKTVAIEIDESSLSFFDVKQRKWKAEAGEFEVQIGSSSRDIRLKKKFLFN